MRILVLFFLLMASLPSGAKADEFYVELGRANTEEEAQAFYTDLQAKHKALADYDVFPNAIVGENGSFIYRVQAGPMMDKNEARKVCNRLMRRKVECYIIEGFDPNKPSSFGKTTKLTSSDFSPPWLAKRQEAAPAPKEEESSSGVGSLFSSITSIFDSGPSEPKKEDEPRESVKEDSKAAKKEAKVDVAEAIPVALSSDKDLSNSVTIGAPVSIAEQTAAKDAPVVQPGWLNVQPFMDEERAKRFWNGIKERAGSRAGGLSLRVVHPVVQDVPKVIANIGRFLSEAEAEQFCKDFVVPASRYLECQFSTSPTDGESTFHTTAAGSNPTAEEENSLYWVEVLNAKSQDAALEQWEKIRTDNDDVLADVRSQITTSLSKPGIYVVRIGPLNARSKAVKLCSTLKSRKLACKLVSL